MLELEDLKELHDKAYNYNQTTRERAADDLVFYWVTQWDDNSLAESQLAYRGEFNILRKAGRQILADLAENPVQIDFEPVDETRDDAADLLDGMYRTDDNHNMTIEAYDTGSQESVVCGFGAWELFTEYSSLKSGSEHQVVRRMPIPEANNTVYFDPNAKLLDKSDADYCSILTAYSEDGYKKLVNDLTGEELDSIQIDSFKQPEQSYTFPWLGGSGKIIYVTKFYHRKKIKEKILTMADPFGQTVQLRESTLETVMDDMLDAGFTIESEKAIERYQVTKYIASGAAILSSDVIAGDNIPVVPVFGERAYVEGEEHWEGVTRLAKDPSRLRNFLHSYLADIVSRSPRQKPIFFQEQIAGFEPMYEESGAENNYPYLLQNRLSGDQTELPIGPVGVMPEQPIPQALIALIDLTRQAVEDVANPGLAQDIADPDLSGKAVLALQARLDMQSVVYKEHLKHAKRRDGEIYASMASEIYDVPRKVAMTLPDGTRKEAQVMQAIVDQDTGDIVVINDLSNSEFEVYSKIGPSYSSQKDQTIERLEKMMSAIDPTDPIKRILLLKTLKIMDGVDFDDIREYANKELVLAGIKEPETPEEKQLLEQASQEGEKDDAAMVLAKAETLKGEADIMREKRENFKVQLDAKNELAKRDIDIFKAKTDRMDTQIDAQEAGAEINYKRIDAFGKRLENLEKLIQLQGPKGMSDDDIFREIAAN